MVSETACYRIQHRTNYRYSEPVAICQNQLRMIPRSVSSMFARVHCHDVAVRIEPTPDIVGQHEDYFGNHVYSFSIESPHKELTVTIDSELTVTYDPVPDSIPALAWDEVVRAITTGEDSKWYGVQEFCFDSPRVRRHERFMDYARASFADGRSVLDAVLDLTKRIHQDFNYDTTATDVNTPTEEAFALKAGVCQDFAHVAIACLRSLGLPAKYVSGYLRTVPREGETRLVGADESHAWVSVYAGHDLGWVGFDPTNACRCNTNHIPTCIGRDYSEVSPMRGVVLGGGKPQLRVSVDVEPVETSRE